MALDVQQNPDLNWELHAFHDRRQARQFLTYFEENLCVYSEAVEQLYTTYHLYYPERDDSRIVVLPDPAAYHDTFFDIPAGSVLATGLYVIPGELVASAGLHLTNLTSERRLGPRQVPFEAGVRRIAHRRTPDDPFLPVLKKGDLREFAERWPVLHLHRLRLDRLKHRSQLERKEIRNAILDKLEQLFRIERGP